jgi:crotonobetainyl-CoA:carnitine CoA-transferase CaiB-like acyl-CoA transferase
LEHADPPISFFDAANRNKRNMALDLTRAEGRDVFLELARQADIIVENFRPGRMACWGCGYEQVRAVKPDIVYISISGYGQYGPYCQRAGYDPQAQAMSGLMWLNAVGDNPPMKAPIYISDELTGLHAAFAALAALKHRDARGEGQHVDVSLIDATVASTGQPTLAAQGLPFSPGQHLPARHPQIYRAGWMVVCRVARHVLGKLLLSAERLASILTTPRSGEVVGGRSGSDAC